MNLLVFYVIFHSEPGAEPIVSFSLIRYLQSKLLKKAVIPSINNSLLKLASAPVVLRKAVLDTPHFFS